MRFVLDGGKCLQFSFLFSFNFSLFLHRISWKRKVLRRVTEFQHDICQLLAFFLRNESKNWELASHSRHTAVFLCAFIECRVLTVLIFPSQICMQTAENVKFNRNESSKQPLSGRAIKAFKRRLWVACRHIKWKKLSCDVARGKNYSAYAQLTRLAFCYAGNHSTYFDTRITLTRLTRGKRRKKAEVKLITLWVCN